MNEGLEYEYDAVNKGTAMSRLLENDDFKLLFLDGFIKDDLIYLGLNVANVPTEKRVALQEQMLARGIVKQYIDGMITQGIEARRIIEEASQEGEE